MCYDNLFPYKDVYNMYIIQNHSMAEMMSYYNISKSTFFKILRYYNIKKDKKLVNQVRLKTVKEKYGVKNVSQCNFVKESKEKTFLAHYGFTNGMKSQVVKNKVVSTNINRYGSKTPAGNSNVLSKMKNTCLDRYGVDNPSLVLEFKNKREQTNLAKFGVKCNLMLESCKEQIKDTVTKRYGVSYYCMTQQCRGISRGSNSHINDRVAKKLSQNNIDYQREFVLNNYIYDFKINNNILLEINPTYTHSPDILYHNKAKPISQDYHYLKTKNALNNGFLCIHVFDWNNIDEIINNIITNKYKECKILSREIRMFVVNLKNNKIESMEQAFDNNCVRVFDDGHDIILKS